MRHFFICMLVLLLGACGGEGEQANEQAERTTPAPKADESTVAAQDIPQYSAEAFFETTSFGLASSNGYAFSADGTKLLAHSDETGVFNVHAIDVASGNRIALTQSDSSATYALSWFPEDGRLLYTRDDGGNELNHVYVREEDGSVRDLTPGEGLKAGFLGWSEDGSAFYLTSNERDPQAFDVYRYSAQDYSRTLVFENPGLEAEAISADGRWLALRRPRTSADADVFLADLQNAEEEPRLLTEHEGNINHTVMTFSPDGKTLVYGTDEHGEYVQAWAYDMESGEASALVYSDDGDVMYTDFSPDGRFLIAAINNDARTEMRILDSEAGVLLDLMDLPDGDLRSVRFDRSVEQLAFLLESSTSPANIYVSQLGKGRARKLTDALNPAIDPAHLVDARVARFDSYDGLEIPGILYKPLQASSDNPVPALVWVHGGPGGQSRIGYSPTIQHLVNHGYAVYAINNRGSSGYGKTFFHLDDKRHGEADLGDVVASKDFLAAKDWIDGERIGIIGGSYGGYMVAAALAFEPDAFDVGVDIFGVTNWVRTLKSIPPWWASFRESLYDELGDPATDEDRLRRISPLFHASNITKPLLVVQGANDPRVLQTESDELVDAVRANDVPVEYIVFPDEGHGFRRRANRITASDAYVNFLDQYLKGDQESAG